MKNQKLTEQEWDAIHKLREEGKSYGEIAEIVGRKKATVNWALNGKKPNFNKPPKRDLPTSKYNFKELEEVNLSSLPNEVLFEHSKEYTF